MRAVVEQEKCIGCSLCTEICPGVFKMELDKAIAYTDPVPEALKDDCEDAVQQCPTNAIDIV